MSPAAPAAASSRREIVVGTLWSLLAWGVSLLAGPLLVVVLARRMERVQFGSLATASAAIGLAAAAVGLGLQPAIARYGAVARREQGRPGLQRILRESRPLIVAATIGAAFLSGLLVLISFCVPDLRTSRFALLGYVPALVITPSAGALGGFLQAAYRPRWTSLAGAVGPLVAACMIVSSAVLTRPTAWWVAGARSAGAFVGACILLWGVVHWHTPSAAPQGAERDSSSPAGPLSGRADRPAILRLGMAMQLGVLFSAVLSELGLFVLGTTKGAHATALLAPAAGIAAVVLAIPGLISSFLLPGIAPAASRGATGEAAALFHWASRWELVVTSPVLAVLVICPSDVLRILFGAGLTGGAEALRILGTACLIQVGFGFNGLTLMAYGASGPLTRIQVLSMIVSVACVGTLIPAYGMVGSAIATLVALAVANLASSTVLYRSFGVPPADRRMLFTDIAFAAFSGLAWFVSPLPASGWDRCLAVAALVALPTAAVSFASERPEERRRITGSVMDRLRRRRAPE